MFIIWGDRLMNKGVVVIAVDGQEFVFFFNFFNLETS